VNKLEKLRTWLQDEWNNSDVGCGMSVDPILHNKDHVFLLFCGWGIHLDKDGTWFAEDTTGG
jgi:hypothetical protein